MPLDGVADKYVNGGTSEHVIGSEWEFTKTNKLIIWILSNDPSRNEMWTVLTLFRLTAFFIQKIENYLNPDHGEIA